MKLFAKTITSVAIAATAAFSGLPQSAQAITFTRDPIDVDSLKNGSMAKLRFDLATLATGSGTDLQPAYAPSLIPMYDETP